MKSSRLFIAACVSLLWLPVAEAADATGGEKIFNEVCSHCHNATHDAKIGPGLAGVTGRRSIEWINAWLKNPGELIKTDEYAKSLHESNKYGMTMPAIPDMKDDEKRASIIEFLKTLG